MIRHQRLCICLRARDAGRPVDAWAPIAGGRTAMICNTFCLGFQIGNKQRKSRATRIGKEQLLEASGDPQAFWVGCELVDFVFIRSNWKR